MEHNVSMIRSAKGHSTSSLLLSGKWVDAVLNSAPWRSKKRNTTHLQKQTEGSGTNITKLLIYRLLRDKLLICLSEAGVTMTIWLTVK